MDQFYIIALSAIGGYLALLAVFSYFKRDPAIAGLGWIGSVTLFTILSLWWHEQTTIRPMVATALITLWAIRLLTHFILRYDRNDPRFISWRNQPSATTLTTTLTYSVAQLPLIAAMIIPSYLINYYCDPVVHITDIIGLALWTIGFGYEALSDYQLLRFLKHRNNSNQVLTTGLWHYSRHPNYFGEIVMWAGLACMALLLPYGYYALIAPAAITIWLVGIVGVPWVETAMGHLPEYQEYQRTTSMIIPLPSKKA